MMLAPSNQDPAAVAEVKDSIDHLKRNGFSKLLQALKDPAVYTRAGRVKHRTLARKLNVGTKALQRMLLAARELLQSDESLPR